MKAPKAWRKAPSKRIMLFGMSGLGKTHISNLLRAGGGWFHYSVDYRIGTRYMGEHIADNFKREAMKMPLLRELADDGFGAHRLEHHLQQPRAPVHLSRQARRPGEGRRAVAGVSAPPGPASHGGSVGDAGHRAFHRRAKSFTATTTSSAIPPARSARSSIRTIRPIRCCRRWRTPADDLDRR